MIITEIFYGIKCNRCSDIHEDGDHSYWNDEGSAEESAMESDWIEEKGKHFCPNCYIDNDGEEMSIKPAYPDHVNSLKLFLKSMTGYSPTIKETEESFILSTRLNGRNEIHPFEESYIQCLMGVNLNSLETKESKYFSKTLEIQVVK